MVYSPEKVKEEMEALLEEYKYENEIFHLRADDLLCEALKELGYEEAVDIFKRTPKYYSVPTWYS